MGIPATTTDDRALAMENLAAALGGLQARFAQLAREHLGRTLPDLEAAVRPALPQK